MRLTWPSELSEGYLDHELAHAAGVFVRDVLMLEHGAQVLITADTRSDIRVIRATAGAVAAAGCVAMELRYPSGSGYDGAPPRAVAAAVAACDTWVEYATGHLIYTNAWRAASAAGVQYVSLGGIDVDGFVRCIGQQDAGVLDRIGAVVIARMTDAAVHVKSEAGTDLQFHTRGAEVGSFRMTANPEKRAIMLAGQVTLALADEASMTGTLVADGILSPPAEVGLLDDPVRFTVAGGRITDIAGGRAARTLRDWLEARPDPNLLRTAHLSLGFNPGIPAPTGRILEDERAMGDLDFGWGAWTNRAAAGHFDFTCRKVTLSCNDVPLMHGGRFADDAILQELRAKEAC
jgi:leucyl aminopeptidase (aminopeptidase T)